MENKMAMYHLPDFNSSILKHDPPHLIGDPYQVGGKWYQLALVRVASWSNIPGQTEYSQRQIVEIEVAAPEQQHADHSYTYGDYNGGGGGPTYPPDFNTPYPVNQGPVPGTYPPPMGTNPPPPGTPPMNDIVTIVFPNPNRKECEKIASLMAKAAYKQEILNLADNVNDPTNEYGVVMTPFDIIVPITPGPEIDINTNGMTIYALLVIHITQESSQFFHIVIFTHFCNYTEIIV